MSQTKIKEVTPEQEQWLHHYYEKWKKILLSNEPLDRKQVSDNINKAYQLVGKNAPNILFFDSPDAVFRFSIDQIRGSLFTHFENPLSCELRSQLQEQLDQQIGNQLEEDLMNQLLGKLVCNLRSRFEARLRGEINSELRKGKASQLYSQLGGDLYSLIKTGGCLCVLPKLDFYISVLNLPHNPQQWEAYQLLVNHGSYILAFDEVCLVSERPTHLSFDSDDNFHAEAQPAIQFADGFFREYIFHGVTLPEKYGMLHSHQWEAKWILEEKNAEVRRLLIETIGYGRICQELQAQQLDVYEEYTLLKIDNVDVEPMYLLKMICPSTRHIHALRVPPNMNSAREAICWVNWGTHPEEFAIQT
ncbi:DUF6745 domain-containing protein [Limnofasciculus baicalensis]|uniref:DUF6745 domain-containing protein n=1 Tax=Limnofasciculus baicalensis BBK-W-15 TaxID=2699891 RepID=A0AAE3KJU2_9CYAN|nr:hypothetical protein [Limnofasciculus baicalensis]MCP2726915.1 hypothetical protein [Limnofasciculus baicalensis BBK-W-15]